MSELTVSQPFSRYAAVLLLGAAAAVGCARDGVGTPTHELTQLISSVSDFAGDPEQFQAMFADEALPVGTERSEYGLYSFRAKEVSISDNAARITVEVSDFDDKLIGEVEWTAVLKDGQWKLNLAPLP